MMQQVGVSMWGAQVGQAIGKLAGEVVSSTDVGLPLAEGNPPCCWPTSGPMARASASTSATSPSMLPCVRRTPHGCSPSAAMASSSSALAGRAVRATSRSTRTGSIVAAQARPQRPRPIQEAWRAACSTCRRPSRRPLLERLGAGPGPRRGMGRRRRHPGQRGRPHRLRRCSETVRRRRATGGPASRRSRHSSDSAEAPAATGGRHLDRGPPGARCRRARHCSGAIQTWCRRPTTWSTRILPRPRRAGRLGSGRLRQGRRAGRGVGETPRGEPARRRGQHTPVMAGAERAHRTRCATSSTTWPPTSTVSGAPAFPRISPRARWSCQLGARRSCSSCTPKRDCGCNRGHCEPEDPTLLAAAPRRRLRRPASRDWSCRPRPCGSTGTPRRAGLESSTTTSTSSTWRSRRRGPSRGPARRHSTSPGSDATTCPNRPTSRRWSSPPSRARRARDRPPAAPDAWLNPSRKPRARSARGYRSTSAQNAGPWSTTSRCTNSWTST